jgi:hypothetical protein
VAPKRSQRAGLARRYDCLLDPILASTSHEVKVRSLTALQRRAGLRAAGFHACATARQIGTAVGRTGRWRLVRMRRVGAAA